MSWVPRDGMPFPYPRRRQKPTESTLLPKSPTPGEKAPTRTYQALCHFEGRQPKAEALSGDTATLDLPDPQHLLIELQLEAQLKQLCICSSLGLRFRSTYGRGEALGSMVWSFDPDPG